MKNDLHGIIYTLASESALHELIAHRNSASIPFGGRYRLIDFALSAMVNAGVRDVGVIMERDYQSLLDHLSSGKDWGLSRRSGGLKLLPPFGLPEAFSGHFSGCMEALRSVRSYIEEIPQENVVLSMGDFVGNIDLKAAADLHRESGADMTAVCAEMDPEDAHHRFVPDEDGFSNTLLFSEGGPGEGIASAEIYILKKDLLLSFMDYCSGGGRVHFHRDAVLHYLAGGGKVCIYRHEGSFNRIASVVDYYQASMSILTPENRRALFPEDRPIRTKERSEVSTYYGENSSVKNCLVADGCYIEGELDSCILFRGVKIEKGVKLKNCIILQDAVVEAGAELRYVIADKDVRIGQGGFLSGSPKLPIVIPKGAAI